MVQKLHIAYDRKDETNKIELPIKTLKRHFAALGSSGSGKTVLLKCVMEEAVRAGIPLLLVDLQGDLASLALMGDKKLMESKGVPGSYWEDYKNKVQIAIFTPASAKGISISMNPLKAPPMDLEEEDRIQAVDSVANTIANILGYKTEKGRGAEVKDYLYLLLEAIWDNEMKVDSFGALANYILKDGDILDESSQMMIDDKTKAGLAKSVKTLTIGAESLIFNLGMPLDVQRMMTWADKGKVPVNILYLNTLRNADDKVNFIADTATQVYNFMLRNPSEDVQLIFVLDELAGLVPPIRQPPSKKSIQLLLKQARKYGVSLILATQNISDVDYKSLGQVGTWALGRLMARQDIDKVKDIIQSISPAETDEILSTLSRQTAGQFMLLAPDVYKSVQPIQARWLVTNHTTLDDAKVKEIMDETGVREKFPEAKKKRGKKSTREKEGLGADGSPLTVDEASGVGIVSERYDDDVAESEISAAVPIIKKTSDLPEIMESKPIAVSAEELAEQTGKSPKSISNDLDQLVTDKKLKVEEVNGVKVFWSPKHKMDPKNNIIGPLFRFQLKHPQGPAKKLMKDKIPATLGIRRKADIKRQKLVWVPLWRINGTIKEAEKRKFRRDKRAVRGFYYVNGATGGILDFNEKEKSMIFPYLDINPEELNTLESNISISPIILDDLDDKYAKPDLNRQDALSVTEERLGLVLNKKVVPSLVWLPIWEFELMDKDTGGKSKAWVDGYQGYLITNASPIDDEDHTDSFFNL
ncbi:MAG: ATP-binding protein [Candidatus Kariarchaeaceae archaeon]